MDNPFPLATTNGGVNGDTLGRLTNIKYLIHILIISFTLPDYTKIFMNYLVTSSFPAPWRHYKEILSQMNIVCQISN